MRRIRTMSRFKVTLVTAVFALAAVAVANVVVKASTHGWSPSVEIAYVGPTTAAPTGGEARDEPGDGVGSTDSFWNDRVTYPTGRFNPLWLRRAASQDARVERDTPSGEQQQFEASDSGSSSGAAVGEGSSSSGGGTAASAPITNSFVALGPKPERMTGCSGCFDYTTTAGRINSIVVDPTTTTNGSIVAYSASDGGGVWKTTNCCSASTAWTAVTDDPLIADIAIDTLAIDPNNHNTIYAGTGDLNYGSLSMGSQGILKSTNAGASWTVLGSTVFGPAYAEPAGQFPQYDSVGKVRVDPNNSNKVVAGTKKGLFLSYNGGSNWTGPCVTNSFATQRQDITGLELSNVGGSTRIIAAVGTRGFATPVQYDLDQNGANGIYSATLGSSGCPSFTSIASNANGFVFGTAVSGSPYTTGASMNAGTGNRYVSTTSGNQLGRIDIAVAPSNPNVIYAQVGSIASNTASGCGTTAGCQLGAWVTTNAGTSWSFMTGSAGGSLRQCASSGAGSGTAGTGDYPQNWYDQGVAVDPNNADRVFFDTFDVWLATRTGTTWYDTTCGYSGVSPKPVHVDQHALAFVPGSSSILLLGNDGGTHGTTNANAAADGSLRPTWFNMDSGYNTIEYYDGDISANFATATSPQAAGGAQDNMDSFVTFTNNNPITNPSFTPVQWQGNIGGDGFFASIDGKGGYFYASNNNGAIHRCTTNCSGTGGVFGGDIRASAIASDRQSFVEPFDLFRGNAGGAGAAECGTRCNHLAVGTYRVWETINSDGSPTITWTARSVDLTKNTLGNRSYINQLHYSPATSALLIAGTNDGNVQVGYGLGGTSTFVNLTGSNAVLPNRPILDVAFDPNSLNTVANPMIGYAAAGGFNANTPSTPGHVFRVICNVNCASFSWQDKTGNLPDIPVDSIVANPKNPIQIFAGTDFGLFFTNDVTAASPTWYRFQNGLSNAMIWSLSIDRGNTALSVWTRSRGAYVWPLPSAAIKQNQTITFAALADRTFGDPDFGLTATADSGLPVDYTAAGKCTVSGSTVHITGGGSCTITASQAGNIDFNAAADVSRTFLIAKAGQSIDFPAIGDKTYGDANFDPGASASSGLGVVYSAAGDCTIAGGLAHITGAGSCTVTASQGGNSDYSAAADVARTFSIARASQTINFGTTDDRTFGDADFEIAADASSGLAVTLAVDSGPCTISSSTSPANVHLAGAGTCSITASQGGDGNYEPAPSETRSFAIGKANQAIDFGTLADKTYGDADFDVSASASSGLAVSFAAADNCTISGNTVHITGAGSCTITASQAGNADYNPAPDVSQTFSIQKAGQTIDFGSLADKTYGDPDFALAASASSNLPVSFTVDGNCVLIDSDVHLTGAGSCTVTASQGGDSNYKPAADVSQTFAIAKAPQTIDFAHLEDKTFGDDDFSVSATSSSGLDVSFAASGDCVLLYGQVDITGAGSCTITASQDGNANYLDAPDASRTFTIGKAGQTITFSAINDAVFGDSEFEIDATASSGLTVSLAVDSGPCTLSSSIAPAAVRITGAGTCVIKASQAGNTNYKAASDVTRSFAIARANQTIDFAALSDKTYGDGDFGVSASASSGLALSFVAIGDCTVSGTTVHITGAGSCTVKASQAGNTDYNPAPDVSRSFSIAKADQTISFAALPNKGYGDPDFSVSANASSGLAVSFNATGACTVSGSTVHLTGAGACTITASQAGTGNYNPAPDVGRTFYVLWGFTGFYSPVDNPPTVNTVQAGSAIPVKFGLGGDRGLSIMAAGSPASVGISCSTSAAQDAIEETVTAGQSSLNYGSGQYVYVWKTDKAWAGTCRQLLVKLVDGSTHTAYFKFK
jgi:hypothetical protein